MKNFYSKRSSAPATTKVGTKKGRYMVHEEIKAFYEAIHSDPALIHRFSKVPMDTVHTLADKIFDLLSTTWKEGLDEIIPQIMN